MGAGALGVLVLATPTWGQEADVGRLRGQAQDLERRIMGKTSENFATAESETVIVVSGVVDLGLFEDQDAPVEGRALGNIDLVIDVEAASVVGEIYNLVAESGEWGGLPGATLPVEGYLTDQGGGAYGVWFSVPMQSVGRATQATRFSMKADLALRGQDAPRVSYGPVAGELRHGAGKRQVVLGAIGSLEVSRLGPVPKGQ